MKATIFLKLEPLEKTISNCITDVALLWAGITDDRRFPLEHLFEETLNTLYFAQAHLKSCYANCGAEIRKRNLNLLNGFEAWDLRVGNRNKWSLY